jgi:hypothetical protein
MGTATTPVDDGRSREATAAVQQSVPDARVEYRPVVKRGFKLARTKV